jgi:hypothetical protein
MPPFEDVEDIMWKPQKLQGVSFKQFKTVIGTPQGWVETPLFQGSKAGQGYVLREVLPNGEFSGRQIQYHPGGGHHGDSPYWRVSDGGKVYGRSDIIWAGN